MSVFGGDSWAREAHNRKRRLDELLLSSQSTTTTTSSSYKKLSNGKLACLVCPNTPVLDSPLMLSVHSKGSRHVAAEKRMRERDLEVQAETNKRNGLSTTSTTCVVAQSKSKPLIDRAPSAIDAGAERSEKSGVCGGSQVDGESCEERRKWREKELQFTAAGWKRDGHGRWYRDENVEFDSDEEDPNVYFS